MLIKLFGLFTVVAVAALLTPKRPEKFAGHEFKSKEKH